MYKVGQKVRVRSWESMEEEFGLDGSGAINVEHKFVPKMKRYCGRIVTIEQASTFGGTYRILEGDYLWSDGMFEPLENTIRYFLEKENRKVYESVHTSSTINRGTRTYLSFDF